MPCRPVQELSLQRLCARSNSATQEITLSLVCSSHEQESPEYLLVAQQLAQNARRLEEERSESARLREMLEKLRLEMANAHKAADKAAQEVSCTRLSLSHVLYS